MISARGDHFLLGSTPQNPLRKEPFVGGLLTWIAVHGGKVVLVVLVGGQLPRAYGVEGMRVGDEVGVSQIRGQVVCGRQSWGVRRRVALWRLRGHHHSTDPRGILQHLWARKQDRTQ